MKRLGLTAGVDVRSHAFRRSLATRWLRGGGSETLLRAHAGWKSPAMVGRYVRMNQEELAQVEYHRVIAGAARQ
jgi:integrase